MGSYSAYPPLVSRRSGVSSTSESTTPSEVDFEDLGKQFQRFGLSNPQRRDSAYTDAQSQQINDQIESFRVQLYLSLIPAGLMPRDAFTVDSRTGVTVLQKPSAQTRLFLVRLETLWQAANFDEDIALHHMLLAVSDRQRDLREREESAELTAQDLERAIARVQREAFTSVTVSTAHHYTTSRRSHSFP
ncbi:Hypothetical predicted protein [Lecanosticta acicola]|uniref:Uncharacterized protein n=1 Tax=Lecanosticta acicola TaxID=111012 RepID=A0AAI8YY81_9PEZI|nr:Hypothetical predicted protein [Lecanosticta acicola]